MCVGHLYGVALYYGTCGLAEHMRGISYSRPEAQYYWVYYAGMNAPWAVVPGCESPPFPLSLSLAGVSLFWGVFGGG